MKSSEVYRLVRSALGSQLKGAGFKRTTGSMPGWSRPVGDMFTVLWFQCSQSGWDDDSGSQFTLEFQRSRDDLPGGGPKRLRFFRLLAEEERERVRLIQNGIICRLSRPGRNHWIYTLDPKTRDYMLDQYEVVASPYEPNLDVWMRYRLPDDVHEWMSFLIPLFPDLIRRFEES